MVKSRDAMYISQEDTIRIFREAFSKGQNTSS